MGEVGTAHDVGSEDSVLFHLDRENLVVTLVLSIEYTLHPALDSLGNPFGRRRNRFGVTTYIGFAIGKRTTRSYGGVTAPMLDIRR